MILKNILSLVLQIFLYLDAYECNAASDWLNPRFSQSDFVLHTNFGEKKNGLVNMNSGPCGKGLI